MADTATPGAIVPTLYILIGGTMTQRDQAISIILKESDYTRDQLEEMPTSLLLTMANYGKPRSQRIK